MYHRYAIRVRRYGYVDTAIREFKKRHSGSIERVSEYRSIEYASIGYGYGWVSEVTYLSRYGRRVSSLIKLGFLTEYEQYRLSMCILLLCYDSLWKHGYLSMLDE